MPRILQLDGCRIDLDERRSYVQESTHRLTEAEVRLLAYLYDNAGRDVSRGELLQEVWGYSPTVRSRAVDQTIKRLRPKIEFDAANPKVVLSVYGVGYRMRRPDADRQVEGAGGVPGHVPEWTGPTVGRDVEHQACTASLQASRTLCVIGPAGIGKSRLVSAVARQWREERAPIGGVWVVDCDACTDAAALLTELGRTLKIVQDDAPSWEALFQVLKTRGPALVVLDNCEGVVESLAELGDAVRASGVHWVFTTRRRAGVPAERFIELEPLTEDAALALFRTRTAALSSQGASPEADCRRLVQQLECNPLAIELAASHANLMSARQIAERFARDPSMLSRLGGGGAGRHSTLQSAIAHSWDLLDPQDRLVLVALSAFQAAFSISGAEAVLPDGIDVGRIQVLRDSSLIRIRYGGTSPRLSLSPWLRAHARLREADRHAEAVQRRNAFLVGLTRDLIDTPNTLPWDGMRPLLRFTPDLEQAVRTVTEPVAAAWLTVGLMLAFNVAGDVYGQGRVLRRFARRFPEGSGEANTTVLLAMAETRIGIAKCAMDERAVPIAKLDGCAERLWDATTIPVRVRCLLLSGSLRLYHDAGGARDTGERALDEAELGDDPTWEAAAHTHCGRMYGMTGDLKRAVSHFESAIDLSSGEGSALTHAYAHYCAGYASLERLDLAEAAQSFEQARDRCDQAGDARAIMLTALLGLIAMGAGDLAGARGHFQTSSRYSAEHVAAWAIEDAMLMGCVEILDGQLDAAVVRLSESVERGRRWGSGPGLAGPLLAACRVHQGAEPDEVAGLIAQAQHGHPIVDAALAEVNPEAAPAPPLAERRGFDAHLAQRLASAWRRMSR